MKSVCADCDIGLKRSDCSEHEYYMCECNRWLKQAIKASGIYAVASEVVAAIKEQDNISTEEKNKMYKIIIENILNEL